MLEASITDLPSDAFLTKYLVSVPIVLLAFAMLFGKFNFRNSSSSLNIDMTGALLSLSKLVQQESYRILCKLGVSDANVH